MAEQFTTEEHLAIRAYLRKFVAAGYSDDETKEARVDKLLQAGILNEASTLEAALKATKPGPKPGPKPKNGTTSEAAA